MGIAAKPSETGAMTDIVGWSKELPLWQQDALRRIVENGDLVEADISELVVLCKRAHGFEVTNAPMLQPLMAKQVASGSSVSRTVTLHSIAEAENVNALDPRQELTFAPNGLTVVFGYNGSGKSGYGRILRRACRARNSGPSILPNVLRRTVGGPASAVITYAIDGVEQPPEQWIDGQRPVEALASVSFFDSGCAAVHVRDKQDIAFTPIGLDLLPKLGAACKEVQKHLDSEKKTLDAIRPKFLQSPIAMGATVVGKFLQSLGSETKIEALETLASLDKAQRQRLDELPGQLVNDPARLAQHLRVRARRIGELASLIEKAFAALSDEAMARLRSLASDYERKSKAAQAAARMNFSEDPLPGVGDEVWRELWEAARRYSVLAYPEQAFPVAEGDDSVCLLCQQPLSEVARDRLRRFEGFVCDDTARRALAAGETLESAIEPIEDLSLSDQAIHDRLHDVRETDGGLFQRTRAALALLLRRQRAIQAVKLNKTLELAEVATGNSVSDTRLALKHLVESLLAEATKLERTLQDEHRKKLEAELAELKAREWLGSVLGDVTEHVSRLVKLEKLKACIDDTKTTKITAKSKALAKTYATDRLRDAFASEINRMRQGVRRLNVELVSTAGEFGSSYYKIQLVGAPDAKVESVVSEGEHQCIALAGFLSDLATQQERSAIVFDDPVDSLDHQWRSCFARRVVEVGRERQIIVFTHDIVFLHDLMSDADKLEIPLFLCRVHSRGDQCGYVAEGLPWIAQKTLQRIDQLEKDARGLQADENSGDERYEEGIRRVYDGLRATVERSIEEWVFRAVVVRHRDYINLKDLHLVTAVSATHCERLQRLFQRCSEMTPAHDRSSVRNHGVPRSDEALADLAELRAIVGEIRDRQKAVA